MDNYSININKTNNKLSPQIMDNGKKNYHIWRWKSRSWLETG